MVGIMEEKFDSLKELYQRLLPALRSKKKEMEREKMLGISELDLFSYFCEFVWKEKTALTLGEMVHDILNTDNFKIYRTRKEGKNETH